MGDIGIKFGSITRATPAELQNFSKMTERKVWGDGSRENRTYGVEFRDFMVDPDRNISIFCEETTPSTSSSTGFAAKFACMLMRENQLTVSFEPLFGTYEKNFVQQLPMKEFRYGDIDGDGDVDIAIKLKDGGVYVFHQETPIANIAKACRDAGVAAGTIIQCVASVRAEVVKRLRDEKRQCETKDAPQTCLEFVDAKDKNKDLPDDWRQGFLGLARQFRPPQTSTPAAE